MVGANADKRDRLVDGKGSRADADAYHRRSRTTAGCKKIEGKETKGRQEDGVTLLGQRSFGRENKLPPVSAPKGSDGSPRNASERPR